MDLAVNSNNRVVNSGIFTDWAGAKPVFFAFLLWQLLVIYIVGKDMSNFAFWVAVFPFYIYLCLFKPKYALIFLLLFTIMDITPVFRLYHDKLIHAFPIGAKILPFHFVLIVCLISTTFLRAIIVDKKILKTDGIGLLILMFLLMIYLKYGSVFGVGVFTTERIIQITFMMSLYFLYSYYLENEKDLLLVIKWLWFGALCMLVYGLYQMISGNTTVYRWIATLPYILTERIAVDMYLMIFTILAIGIGSKSKFFKSSSVFIVLLYFIILPFTFKRGALLGAVVGLIVTIYMLSKQSKSKQFIRVLILGLIGISIIIALFYSPLLSAQASKIFVSKFQSISLSNIDASGAMRIAQWIRSFEIIGNDPLWGLPVAEHFKLQFGPYNLDTVLDNNYLYIAIYFGPLCLLLYILMLWKLIITALKTIKNESTTPQIKYILIGTVGALSAFFVSDIFEVHISLPSVAPYYILCFAIISISSRIASSKKVGDQIK